MEFRLICIIILCLGKVVQAQPPTAKVAKLNKQAVTEDLDYLYQSLRATHYNLFAFKEQQAYDSLFGQLRSSLKEDSFGVATFE